MTNGEERPSSDQNIDKKVQIEEKTNKSSFFRGVGISSLTSIILIFILGIYTHFNPYFLGQITAQCLFAIIIVGFISKLSKMSNLKLALVTIGLIIFFVLIFGIKAK